MTNVVLEENTIDVPNLDGAKRPGRLRVENLSKRYTGEDAGGVNNINFEVAEGEILALLGPSGSGKSTILKCIAGLERPDAGDILVDERPLSAGGTKTFLPPEKRGVSVVFQSLALWPHLTVFDNVAYPLKCAKVPKDEITVRVRDILELVGCRHLMGRRPGEISGGEQQRVACARALVGRPSLVLFDEPFSSLDAALRTGLRRWLLELRDETNMTAVFVTHDQVEAFTVGDRVAVLFEGDMAAIDVPRRLHERPPLTRVATFLGSMNLFPSVVQSVDGGTATVTTELGELRMPIDALEGDTPQVGSSLTTGIRPSKIELEVPDQPNTVHGRITFARFVGVTAHYEIDVDGTSIEVVSATDLDHQVGETISVSLPADDLRLFVA